MNFRNFEEMVQQVQQRGTKTRVAVPMDQDGHTLKAIVKARQEKMDGVLGLAAPTPRRTSLPC